MIIGGTNGGPAVYLQSEIHAREWICPSTAMFLMVEMLESDDAELRRLVELMRFVIIPVANPDGYRHTWTEGGRQWRKSRSPNEGSECLGTDLNRNFDGGDWGGPGASTNPCSGTYRGAGPFSEAEPAAVRDFIVGTIATQQELLGGIDYHSFGQIFLRPYAWSSTEGNPPPNDGIVAEIGDAMAVAAEATPDGAPYTAGGWYDDLYPSSGVCADWLYNVTYPHGVSFTAELRDTGQFGFVLPDSEILPTAEEQLASLKEYTRRVLEARAARRHA